MDLGSCRDAYHRLKSLPLFILFLTTCFQLTAQNARHRRAATGNEPSIVTQDGHLLFQTGRNHNITFQSAEGGHVNINGKNLGALSQQIQDNQAAITQLQSDPKVPPNLPARLDGFDNRLNNLVPTGQVATKFADLTSSVADVRSKVPANLSNRLTQVEGGLSDLQPTGEVARRLTSLSGRLDLTESQIRSDNADTRINDLHTTVNTLHTTTTTSITGLQGRISDLQSSTTSSISDLQSRFTTMEQSVTQIQQALTTNNCGATTCQHDGTCITLYQDFFCICPREWTGKRCDIDVDECREYAGTDLGCQHGGTCHNNDGGYTCECPPNYHGPHCTDSHDDCTGASSEALCGHGTCVNRPRAVTGQPKYRCICDQGWKRSGSDPACVVDEDECTGPIPHCSRNPLVQCINIPGSFVCGPCPTGYSGNGNTCFDIDECQVNNGGCSTAPYVQCTNTVGSFTCGPCPAGYATEGRNCRFVGVCQQDNGGCSPHATCRENPGIGPTYRVCECNSGYTGNGVGSSGCSPDTSTGVCGAHPCHHGGVCSESGSSFTCSCQMGYTGSRCETEINECATNPSPCLNGGSCTDRINGFVCNCTGAWTGLTCNERRENCGGALLGESGSLRYPQQPGRSYDHGLSCPWTITTTRGKVLNITFTTFNLESHVRCNFDFLQINDGPTASSHQIGQYCGSDLPNGGTIVSTHNQLYLWLKTDASVSRDGFSLSWVSQDPVCGSDIVAEYGTISSPGYPGDYPHNSDCVWTVSVPPGNLIHFTFANIQIEHHSNCQYDYLEFRDGLLDTSPVLQRYCSTVSPAPLQTTGPSAWILFHSDASLNDKGFQITFSTMPAPCGGVLTDVSGSLSSPGYPTPYQHDGQCVWQINVTEAETISLTFTDMDLESHSSCGFDYVEVRDGPDEESSFIGRYCDTVPATLTSTTNQMWIKFKSDMSVAGTGFSATYTTVCGGTFTTPTGVLTSPNYPNSYPSNKECTYLISQEEGLTISLHFTAFDVEGASSSGCTWDYVQVFDGSTTDTTMLGSFCSNQIPPDLASTGNFMLLKFVTDGSVQNLGFRATYSTNEGGLGCGGYLTDNTGVIESPGHPNNYPHGANCTWFISVPDGQVIRLTFNSFSIEQHSSCQYDSVEVFDNSTATDLGNSLGKFCGSSSPPVLTSSGNTLSIQLISDSSIAFGGFSASYVALNVSTLCGSDLTDNVGVITSPGYPANYPHMRRCTWTITVPSGQQILLNVTNFRLESHSRCQYDYLEIRNGGFVTSPLIGRYCGTTIDSLIRSHSNRLWLRFVSDNSLSAPGFRIVYDGTASGCGADMTTPTGSFVSPNYPYPYSHSGECFWTITTSRGSKIQLVFVAMDVESHFECRYDYVQVKDGDSNGNELGRFCGTQLPDPIFSISNSLWVKFRADPSISGNGFHAAYYTSCDTTLTDHSGVIESPNFPNAYPHNRNCTWVVHTTQGNTINASFSHFDVEDHSSCRYDYVQIRDGPDETANLINTYCGTTIPAPIATTQEYMWVRFLSDFSLAGNGFRLEYITNGCGGYLTTPTGRFTSPNYPNPYSVQRVCEWTIIVPTGSAVQINVTNFDLEAHPDCRYDYLRIYTGIDASAPLLTELCNSISAPQIVTSSGNRVFVRFRSDISVTGNGFEARYEAVDGGCGGNFTAENGVIMSKNYPNNYPDHVECDYLISLQDSQLVVLTFLDFDVEGSNPTDCRYDYVAVFDGDSQNATELLRHCGDALPPNPVIRSSGNQMFIRFKSDGSVNKKGFKAQYVKGCGGIINADVDGAITSPNYPDVYDLGSNCTWLLQARRSNERITLTFTHMETEALGDCTTGDFVQVFNGDSSSSPLVGSYCGTTIPPPITSQGSALYVIFQSDMSGQRQGFRATYSTSVSTCGGDYTAENGAFNSPNYPNSYPIRTECVWTISTSPGNRIDISFSLFDLEFHSNCNFDYLEIREGGSTGRLVGRYCGDDIPSNVTALSRVWMLFHSDPSATGVGFMADYNTVYGGEITGTSGQVASPLYPSQYPHNTEYNWRITVAVGYRIRVTFQTLDMEDATGCVYDYIRFRDGGLATSPLLQSYCGNQLPSPFISTTNQLRAEFHSDFSSTGQGFLFNWTQTSLSPIGTTTVGPSVSPLPGCGEELVAEHDAKNITSPNYPSNYPNSADCEWQISTEPGHRIWFNITDIFTESHISCQYDDISVFDAAFSFGSYPGRLMGKFCDRTGNDEPIIVSSNRMTVTFTSDSSVTRRGFSAMYKSVCGGTIRNTPTGELHSPNYPNNYDNNANCTWILRVAPGRTIQATLNTFNLPSSSTCNTDYLLLLNGDNADSPALMTSNGGRLCGSSVVTLPETASNTLYLSFVSDSAGTSSGFSLTWNEVEVSCSGSLRLTDTISSGVFTSPNYPSNYPHNVDCIWVITGPAAERIQIDFDSDFDIEDHGSCGFDYIELRDGGTENAASLGRFCGSSAPSSKLSTGNVMYARFQTDNSVPRTGFKATYKIATCGGSINGASGSVMSPNYPQAYENNADCEWFLTGPTGHYLTISFEAFNLQSATNCSLSDYLEVRETNATGALLFRGCGNSLPASVDTSDSFAYIRFKTDSSTTGTGFKLNFQASVEECGGTLTTPTGTFTSPNYPGLYAHARTCTWLISVQAGRRITLTFNDFHLEYSTTCLWDYVEVFNGILDDSPRLARLCGQNGNQTESSGNTMRVRFHADQSVSHGGFSASYSSSGAARCGGDLPTDSPGNITSPGYGSGNYTNNQQCVWTLTNRNTVNSSWYLSFLDFAMETSSNCGFDFLEIREGEDEAAPLYARVCNNHTNPDPVFSPSPYLWLRFRTDSSIVDRGFDLHYRTSQCGGLVNAASGVITSPNYPSNYDHLDACAWLIQAPEGNQITVNATDFSVESHPNCNYDYLEIFNGGSASSPSIGKFCGGTPMTGFRSQSNQLRLVFKTDGSASMRGFRLTYSFVTAGCGGLFHGNQGFINSPNFPGNYPHNIECDWIINVKPGYHVSLAFNSPFDLEAANCRYDYIQVYDVLRNGSMIPLGPKYCGTDVPPVQSSTANQLALKLRTDSTTAGTGFSANWTSACGATFTEDSGDIVSPGFPVNYDNNLQCNYTILIDPQRFVVLAFDDRNFNLEGGTTCQYDSVQVYSGNDSSSRSLGKFCGSTAPQPLSTLGHMLIQFTTDSSITDRGFRASYRVSDCGGVFTDSHGIISSPTHPVSYHNNLNCTYNITVSEDRVVELRFNRFNLEAHSQCRFDYVEIHDGATMDSRLIGRFCGTDIQRSIKSTGNSLLVNFVTDSSVTRDGFSASYTETLGVRQGCGGVFNQSSGSISSPDVDGDGRYESSIDCVWRITVDSNKVVQFTVSNLDIEYAFNCNFDYLEIRDGLTPEDTSVGKLCGQRQNYLFQASSNALYLRFHADGSVTAPGFNATFTQVDRPCGGNLMATEDAQTINSIVPPSAATNDFRCRWVIDSPLGKQVRLTTTSFNIADTGDCNLNYLELRDTPMGDLGRNIHYCGTTIPPVFDSAGRTVQVNYVINQRLPASSFQMTYAIAGCNKTYTGDSGRILSPGWPNRYPHGADCPITVTTPPGTMIALYFTSFFMEYHPNCGYDFLQVYNGSTQSDGLIGQFCGRTNPDPIFATGNNLLLRLRTDASVSYAGFDISYTSSYQALGCGGNFSSINGSFTSPGYPGNYTMAQTCDYLITVPARRRVTLKFTEIGILGAANCTSDYVKVFVGSTATSPILGTYCGDTQPSEFHLGRNQVFIRFVSDGLGSAVYFRIEFNS